MRGRRLTTMTPIRTRVVSERQQVTAEPSTIASRTAPALALLGERAIGELGRHSLEPPMAQTGHLCGHHDVERIRREGSGEQSTIVRIESPNPSSTQYKLGLRRCCRYPARGQRHGHHLQDLAPAPAAAGGREATQRPSQARSAGPRARAATVYGEDHGHQGDESSARDSLIDTQQDEVDGAIKKTDTRAEVTE